ncbi:unnamed protein product [Prorocentrum cordatum]|uniref:Uncharacterized protein n=1 Tax=Prorocentrum cordatum TaxID=2364126 RepID=A0ABN9VPN4_9DINO|nr:unnamed protein product [Polarella glacialis]
MPCHWWRAAGAPACRKGTLRRPGGRGLPLRPPDEGRNLPWLDREHAPLPSPGSEEPAPLEGRRRTQRRTEQEEQEEEEEEEAEEEDANLSQELLQAGTLNRGRSPYLAPNGAWVHEEGQRGSRGVTEGPGLAAFPPRPRSRA